MVTVRTSILTLCILLPVLSTAGLAGPRQQRSPLATLDWLGGMWVGTEGGTRMEEFWLHPSGGMMLGLHRDIDSSGFTFFEYLRIEVQHSRIVYIASPQGRPPTVFPAVEIGRGRVVFENVDHDFPQRVIYALDEAGALHVRVEGMEDGTHKSREWVWTRRP